MYKQRADGWLKHLDFILLDILTLQFSFVIAFCLRHGLENPYLLEEYRGLSLLLLVANLLVLFFGESMRGVMYRGYWKEMENCIKSAALITFITTFALFAVKAGADYSRLVCLITGVLYCILNYLVRTLWKHYLRTRSEREVSATMLVAGEQETLESVLKSLERNKFGLPKISGVVLLDAGADAAGEFCGYPVVSTLHNLEDYICHQWVDEILIVKRSSTWIPELREITDRIASVGVAIHNVLDFGAEYTGLERLVERVGGYPVITSVIKSVTPRQAFFKRGLDIAGGLVGSIIAVLAVVVVGPILYLQSPGPVIFRQIRVGRNGKPFTMYKLRSMVLDAEAQKQKLADQNRVADGMMFKLDFDPRIIGARQLPDGTIKKGIGNFIRDWSIDELPQFWNVLKGDMSLVGTRPPTMDEWNKYALHQRARMAFRPGITGMWQVSGRSKITDFDEVVRLDMAYITNWTPGLDLRILFQTVFAVLKRKGAM